MNRTFRLALSCIAALTGGIAAAHAQGLQIPGQAQPRAQRQPPAQPQQGGGELGPVVGDAKIIVRPSIRIGQKMTVRFQDMPDSADQDMLVVYPAGAPDAAPDKGGDKPLANAYAANKYYVNSGWEIGPFAPGRYEVRWLTTLYNNEKTLEVGARAQFSVTR
jgi:hypothetical protein